MFPTLYRTFWFKQKQLWTGYTRGVYTHNLNRRPVHYSCLLFGLKYCAQYSRVDPPAGTPYPHRDHEPIAVPPQGIPRACMGTTGARRWKYWHNEWLSALLVHCLKIIIIKYIHTALIILQLHSTSLHIISQSVTLFSYPIVYIRFVSQLWGILQSRNGMIWSRSAETKVNIMVTFRYPPHPVLKMPYFIGVHNNCRTLSPLSVRFAVNYSTLHISSAAQSLQ